MTRRNLFVVTALAGIVSADANQPNERQGTSRRYPKRNEPTSSALSLLKAGNSKSQLSNIGQFSLVGDPQ